MNPPIQSNPWSRASDSGPSAETLGVAIRLLGDDYNQADFSGLTDAQCRRAIAARVLGRKALNRSSAFLDRTWHRLANEAPAQRGIIIRDEAGQLAVRPVEMLSDADLAALRDSLGRQ